MKKRSKKYNPNKVKQLRQERIFKIGQAGLMYIEGDEYSSMFNVKSTKRVEYVLPEIVENKFRWTIYPIVLLREKKNSEEKFVYDELGVSSPMLHTQISKSVIQAHSDLKDHVNRTASNAICGYAWIATPYTSQLSELKLFEILHNNGAWNNLAGWEKDLLKKGK